jgi:hypothetical protein
MNQQYAPTNNFNNAPVNQQARQNFSSVPRQNEEPIRALLNEAINGLQVRPLEPAFRIKHVAYGGKAAFQVEQSMTKDERHTVMLESAPKLVTNDPNDKRYDWSQKLSFQLSQEELPFFIGVFLGIIPSVRFDMHGQDKSKFLEVINQGNKYFLKNGSADRGIKVAPVSIVEGFQFGLLGLNQYTKNYPHLSSDAVLTSIRMLLASASKVGIIKQPK